MNLKQFALSCLLLGFVAKVFGQEAEQVFNWDGKMHVQVEGNPQPMKAAVTFPGEIVINTNGVFKVGQGKERQLEPGQAITQEGMLYKPDGSVRPVFDHYVAKGNRAYLVKDGEPPALVTQAVMFPDSSVLQPDVFYSANGNLRRLIDGQTLGMQGATIPALDTVTLKNGKVAVQKEGALLPVAFSYMAMNDGTRVYPDGTLISFDGKTTTRLREGETITLPGAVLRR